MRGSERSELQRVKRQIAFWRKVRCYQHEAMPENLWRSAGQLCKVHGLNHVRKTLGLDASKLKKKVIELNGVGEEAPEFINVELPNRAIDISVCEWVRPDGAKLRMKIRDNQLKQLVSEFFASEPARRANVFTGGRS